MVGKTERKGHQEDLDVDGRIMFTRIFGKYGGTVWIRFS
jgi:hypothetical protein